MKLLNPISSPQRRLLVKLALSGVWLAFVAICGAALKVLPCTQTRICSHGVGMLLQRGCAMGVATCRSSGSLLASFQCSALLRAALAEPLLALLLETLRT